MGKNKIRIIAIILLMAFIAAAAFIPVFTNAIIPDNSAYCVFMQMVFLVIAGICFFPFIKIILFTHKLE